jgi:hypothetical protein
MTTRMTALEKYKHFWKQIEPVVAEHDITGFHVVWAGCGDNGHIDELNILQGGKRRPNRSKKLEEDSYGNKMSVHPWWHDREKFVSFDDLELVVPDVTQIKETFKDGWVKEEIVGDCPLEELVMTMSYVLCRAWFPGWEINDGSTGTFYFYPKCVEFEFIEYYTEDEDGQEEQGHKTYSLSVPFREFDNMDYDDGYRGRCIDQVIPSENDENEDEQDEE